MSLGLPTDGPSRSLLVRLANTIQIYLYHHGGRVCRCGEKHVGNERVPLDPVGGLADQTQL